MTKKSLKICFLPALLLTAVIVFTALPAQAQFWNFFHSNKTEDKYDFTNAQIVSQVILLVKENYIEPKNIKPQDMFIKSLEHIEVQVPQILVDATNAPRNITVTAGQAKKTFNIEDLDQVWEISVHMRNLFRFIKEQIPLTEKEQRDVEYSAISGILATLDPHTVFLTPRNFEEMHLSTSGEFGGLGIVISVRDNMLTVISPISGTPAAKAGIKALDKITRIAEESTVNMSLEEAVERLRGKKGTKVTIWVLREGWTEAKKFTLTRDIIKIKSVTSKLLANDIGYVQIKNFQKNTYDDMVEQITAMQKAATGSKGKLKGIILDLRNNPGGLLDQAIYISDYFIKEGALVITEGGGETKVEEAENQGIEPECPIVVLMNGGSASASEIVAGALKNHKLGLVMGQQSFGKGTVQVLYDDFADKSALKLTIAQYLTPGNISIQGVGITPDILLNPINATKDALHLMHDTSLFKESNFENVLGSDKTGKAKEAKTSYTVDYIQPVNNDKEQAQNSDDFVSDAEIEIAQRLLASLKISPATRSTMLKEAGPIFNKLASEQQKELTNSLRTIGIDWRSCPHTKNMPAETFKSIVKFDIHPEEEAATAATDLHAGDKLILSVTVTNKGSAPFCQLKAHTQSDSGLFDRREFVFGYIPAGASRTWDYKLEVSKDTYPWSELVELVFEEENNHLPTHGGQQVRISEKPLPQFAFKYSLKENEGGNGDGLLDVGEGFDLLVTVKNIGTGIAPNTVLAIKNEGGKELFLDKGRFNLDELKVGEEKTGTLTFHVRDAEIEGARLKLTIYDSNIGEYLVEDLKWPIQTIAAAKKNKAAAPLVVDTYIDAPQIIIPDKYLGSMTNEAKVSLHGQVVDKEKPLDVYIFVNNQKVYYQVFQNAQLNEGKYIADFTAALPLKEGPNIVSVIARESKTLVKRRTFAIYRNRTVPGQVTDALLKMEMP